MPVSCVAASGKLVDIRSAGETWGEMVRGIAARLRTERRPEWREDYPTPWVLFDLKNDSKDLEVTLRSGGALPCCTIPIEAECLFGLGSHHPIISLQGIPSSVIVFRILHPILASTLCDANPRARIAGPKMIL